MRFLNFLKARKIWVKPTAGRKGYYRTETRVKKQKEKSGLGNLVPDEKDRKRGARNLSYAQRAAQANAIKNLDKALRRGIAFAEAHEYDAQAVSRDFRERAVELGASEEQLNYFDQKISEAFGRWRARIAQQEKNERQVILDSIPEGLAKNLESGGLYKVKGRLGKIRSHFSPGSITPHSFNSVSFWFTPIGRGKEKYLGETTSTYGNNYLRYQAGLIKKFKIKKIED